MSSLLKSLTFNRIMVSWAWTQFIMNQPSMSVTSPLTGYLDYLLSYNEQNALQWLNTLEIDCRLRDLQSGHQGQKPKCTVHLRFALKSLDRHGAH